MTLNTVASTVSVWRGLENYSSLIMRGFGSNPCPDPSNLGIFLQVLIKKVTFLIIYCKKKIWENMLDINSFEFFKVLSVKSYNLFIIII